MSVNVMIRTNLTDVDLPKIVYALVDKGYKIEVTEKSDEYCEYCLHEDLNRIVSVSKKEKGYELKITDLQKLEDYELFVDTIDILLKQTGGMAYLENDDDCFIGNPKVYFNKDWISMLSDENVDIPKAFDDNKLHEKFLFKISKYDCSMCEYGYIPFFKQQFVCKIKNITHENIAEAIGCPQLKIKEYFKKFLSVMKKLEGTEHFVYGDKITDMTTLDVWKYHFCNRFNMQEYFGEFLVAKALGIEESYNSDYWRLYDINYSGKRIEVKTSSYYHAFKEHLHTNISERRVFGITKAYSDYKDKNSSYERQNDIYVFCLNTGKTPDSSDPLDLNNWEFYIVPTKVINEECGDAKTISIQKIRKLGFEGIGYFSIKEIVDNLLNEI